VHRLTAMVRSPRVLPTPQIGRRRAPAARRVACVLVALACVGQGGLRAAPDLFDELHARIRLAEAKRQTIRARFTETTISSLLVKPLVAEGTLVGAKPARLLMTYRLPEPRTILLDGNQLLLIRPDRGETERIDVTEIMKRVNHYFVNANPEQLRKSFTVRAFVDPEAAGSYQIDLLPRRKQIRRGLERLQIWVAQNPLLLAQIRITFAGGDTTTVRIEDAELNVALPPNAFSVDIPPARPK
jgi:outer membrane lipoprotein-sorting protein